MAWPRSRSQIKSRPRCSAGDKRFTVIRVDYARYDTHAGRNFAEALRSANPDRGSSIEVFVTCARDAGDARLPSNDDRWSLTRTFKYRGRK